LRLGDLSRFQQCKRNETWRAIDARVVGDS
jgi:hypothetical protein